MWRRLERLIESLKQKQEIEIERRYTPAAERNDSERSSQLYVKCV